MDSLVNNPLSYIEVMPDDELLEMFTEARTNIVLGSSLYAYTLGRCEYIYTYDISTAGACVHDERNIIFINPDFFKKELKNRKQRAFLIVHELDHIFFEHQSHCIEMCYDHGTFNEAADYFINLATAGVYLNENGSRCEGKKYKLYFEMPEIGLYDERFLGMGSDEIYRILIDEKKKNPSPNNQAGGSGSGSGSAGGNGKKLDVFFGNGGSHQKKSANAQTTAAAVVFAQQNNAIGENEGNLVNRINEMHKPVISWTDKLCALVQSSVRERPTYNRISRRSCCDGDGVIFPTFTGNCINVLFGFDTSGSMGQNDYAIVAGELQGILEQFDSWNLHLVCCDVKLHEIGYYSSEDQDTFSDISLDIRGGGGTDMSPIAKQARYLTEVEGVTLDACIVVTDGDIIVRDLDDAFTTEITNIVVSTRKHNKLEFKNAECITI